MDSGRASTAAPTGSSAADGELCVVLEMQRALHCHCLVHPQTSPRLLCSPPRLALSVPSLSPCPCAFPEHCWAVTCMAMTEAPVVSGSSEFWWFVNSEGISQSVTGTAALWGPGVLRLSLLPCEQFISFTDRQLLTSHSPEDEMSCLIRFKLVLSLAFPINKLSSRCHYLISIF